MKKNFLLLLLLALLPLAMWATKPNGSGHVTGKSGLVFKTGAQEQVLLNAVTAPNNHGTYDTSVGKVFYLVKDNSTAPIKSNPNWVKANVGDIPSTIVGTDAKTYYVFYYFTNDGTINYDEDGDVAYITVAIGKKTASADDGDFTAPTPVSGLVFDNTAKAVVSATKPASGHFVYQYRQQTTYSSWSGWSWSGWSGWSEDLPTGTNAREYQIRYRYINEDGNYNDWNTSTYQTITAQIARATWGEGAAVYTAPTQKADAVFNNTNQNMVTPGTTPAGWGAEMQYATSTWRNTVDHNDFRSTNVMQNPRTVYYRIQGGNGYNWNALSQTSISVNILPADAPAATGGALATSPLTYTGEAQPLITTGFTATILGGTNATVRYWVNGVDRGTNISNIKETEFGEYEISYSIDYSGYALRNYKPVTDPRPVLGTVKIEKAKLTIANVGYTKDFDNVAFEATPENVVKFVDGLGWVHGEDAATKAEILGKLLTVKSGLPQINVGAYDIELQSQEDASVSYVIDPLFHETAQLNILKIDNTWKNDVSIATTWPYGTTPATPSAEPNLTKKEDGTDAEITYKYYKDAACTVEMDAPTATTDAGTYYVKAFVEGCNNFFPLESATAASFEITPTSPTWAKAVAMEGWEYTKYNATTNAPSAEAIDDATITFKYYEDAGCTTEIDAADVPKLGVGKYYVKAFAAATANHTADENGPAEFEVTPTVLPATGIADVESVYDATNQNPGETVINAAIKAATGLEVGTDYELSFDPSADFTNVGEYYVIATGKGNYAKEVDGDVNVQKVKYTITQADIPLADIVPAKAKNLTYNNTDQVLAEPASIKSSSILVGDFEYSLDGTTWTVDVPAAKNAGEYKVYTKFTPSGNFKDNFEVTSIDAKILQKQIGYMLSNFEKTWDGLELSPENIEKCYSLFVGELQGDDEYVAPFTLKLPKNLTEYMDAGTYTFKQMEVEWTNPEVQNYKINWSGTGEVQINKADIEAADYEAPTKTDLTYNRDKQDLVNAGKVLSKTAETYPNKEFAGKPYGTMMYATAEDGDYTEEIPQGTDKADYVVWYYVKGDDNHNDTKPNKVENTIAPKVITFALQFEDANETFTGDDFMPKDKKAYDGDGFDPEVELTEGTDYELAITDDATELINVGEYTFTYTGIGNYEGSAATRTIKIAAYDIENATISDYAATAPYNAIDQKPAITLTYGELELVDGVDGDFDLAITKDGAEFTEDEFVNAGKYVFTYTGKGNYAGKATAEFEITPLDVIAEAADATKVYDGTTAFKDEPAMKYSGVLKDDVVEFDASAAFKFAKLEANFGTYPFTVDAEAITVTPANYKVIAANGANFEITKKNLMVKWKEGATGFTKAYGAEDPELKATAENLNIIDAVAGEEAEIINQTKIIRAEGEAVGKYAVTLSAKGVTPSVFANYNVAFDEDVADVFTIAAAELTIALAPQEKAYDGKDAAVEVTVDKLIVTGLKNGDTKEKIFAAEGAELPTAKVAAAAAVAGEYQVTLEGGKLADYTIKPLQSIFTINKAVVTSATLADAEVLKGTAVEDINFEFEVEGANSDLFKVVVADEFVKDGAIFAEEGGVKAGALSLVPVNDEAVANIEYTTVTADLTIIATETVVLADNAAFVTEAKEGVNVTFTDRAINAGKWNVVALPFAATIKQISDAFGYAAVDVLNEAGNIEGEVHFTVLSSGSVPAYTPFLVKTTEDDELKVENFNEITFENVNIEACDGTNTYVQDAAKNKFWGTFQAETVLPAESKEYWYMSKGTWYDTSKRTKAVTLKPFRAYVQFDTVPADGARIFVEEPDGTITAISGINAEGQLIEAEGWYTVNGMKLNAAPAQKGTYIKDGKKVIVK